MTARPTLVLAGIGADAHTVGLSLLRHTLTAGGYDVVFMGIQNDIDDVRRVARHADAVLVSVMDGHCLHYLRDFEPDAGDGDTPLWYIGGNLAIDDGSGLSDHLRARGFHRVFVKYVDLAVVVDLLHRDMSGRTPRGRGTWAHRAAETHRRLVSSAPAVGDDPLDPARVRADRAEVLAEWPTGREAADLSDNAVFLSGRPGFPALHQRVDRRVEPPVAQVRVGVPTVAGQRAAFARMERAGSRVLSYQVDSLTRARRFADVAQILADGANGLNGFPVINHGVPVLRRLALETALPLGTRHSMRDPRLLAEISFAGGVTSFEGGALSYNLPYHRDYPLEASVRDWQYVDRLVGRYAQEYGVAIDREFFGPLTGTLVPPSVAIAVNVCEALLAAGQGARHLSLGLGEHGNRVQDLAAARVLRATAARALTGAGHRCVHLSSVFHQYMGAFPTDASAARRLIAESALLARSLRPGRVIVKTPVEARRIPTLAENIAAQRMVGSLLAQPAPQPGPDEESAVDQECEVLQSEVDALLDAVVTAGSGSIARGVVLAVRDGLLDVPFAPSVFNRGEATSVRDCDGAVRWLDTGRLPLPAAVKAYHADKIAARRRRDGVTDRRHDHRMIAHDLLQIPRGDFETWPMGSRRSRQPEPVVAG